tara:strand:- start:25798 stop:26340 length:543 start_codon:yes stop_codon:yes gene_type:complete
MKVVKINAVGKLPVYDLSVNSEIYDEQQYVLENGVITHNTGIMYSADNVWIIGRQQEKVGTEIVGYNFVINVEKSRFVKEKSKIPIGVSWAGGVQKYSGLLDAAIAGGYVFKPSNGWYQKIDKTTGEVVEGKYRMKETLTGEFWDPILEFTDFPEFLKETYKIGYSAPPVVEAITQEAYN